MRRAPGEAGEINLDSRIVDLVQLHPGGRLEEDNEAPATMTTYCSAGRKLTKFIGGLRVGEATPARLDAAIRSMRTAHGVNMARHGRTLMRGALQLAVMANVLGSNPVRDVSPIVPKSPPKGAPALTGAELGELLSRIAANDYCVKNDLVDPITIFVATGLSPVGTAGAAVGRLRREGGRPRRDGEARQGQWGRIAAHGHRQDGVVQVGRWRYRRSRSQL